jgi:hypothetical protein
LPVTRLELGNADLMDSAERIMCMTFAFNLDEVFEKVLLKKGDTLRYAVFDKNLKEDVADQIDQVEPWPYWPRLFSGLLWNHNRLEQF